MFEYNNKIADIAWDITFVLAIIATITLCMSIYTARKEHLKRVTAISDNVILICMFTATVLVSIATLNRTPIVNINRLDSQIHVDGAKITIDPLPEGYEYNFFSKFYTPSEKKSNIFRFEQDEFYGTTRLIAENGSEFKLSDDDTKFLKERGAKNG
jgi:hypothetical protein